MKKYIKIVFIALILMIPIVSYGATAQVTVDSKEVAVGQETIVTVTYSGTEIGRVDGILEYDVSALSYISGGSSKGDGGAVQLKKAGTGDPIVFKMKFKGVKEGKTPYKITTYEAYDLNEQPMSTANKEGNIQVISGAAGDGAAGEDVKSNTGEEEEKQVDKKEKKTKDGEEEPDSNAGNKTPFFLIGGILVIAILIVVAGILYKKKK